MTRFLRRLATAGAALCASPSFFSLAALGDEGLPPVGSAGGPSRSLSWSEAERWLAGRELFRREFQDRDGLGAPGFNARSCAICHKDPVVGGAGGPDFDVLTTRAASPYSSGKGAGDQLARMRELRARLVAHNEELARALEIRQTPSLLGLGLIDTIPDEEILRNEDAKDVNRDGVRGIASRAVVGGTTEVGRFGWKAEVPRLSDFVCRALGGELGLTAPDQGRGFGLAEDTDRAPDPETSQEALDDLGFFVANLAAPVRGRADDTGQVWRGERIFERLGCVACHVPTLEGTEGPVPLYSDLLLHEIQKPEEAGTPKELPFKVHGKSSSKEKEPTARTSDRLFRTAPLWGVGGTAPYLHDGSAKTLADAVLSHDGEAAGARDAYAALSKDGQQALEVFLASL